MAALDKRKTWESDNTMKWYTVARYINQIDFTRPSCDPAIMLILNDKNVLERFATYFPTDVKAIKSLVLKQIYNKINIIYTTPS